jgi:hypothetical protein
VREGYRRISFGTYRLEDVGGVIDTIMTIAKGNYEHITCYGREARGTASASDDFSPGRRCALRPGWLYHQLSANLPDCCF